LEEALIEKGRLVVNKAITPKIPQDIYDRLEQEWRVIDPERPELPQKPTSFDDGYSRLRISRVD
jgi:hypothetical protein